MNKMGNVQIKNINGVFDNVCEIAEDATKKTLYIYYPRAGLQTRKTRQWFAIKHRKIKRGTPGKPFKVLRWSWGDPQWQTGQGGYKRGITNDGVFLKYKFHRHDTAYSGTKWVNTMEEGGPGLPGETAVRKVVFDIHKELLKGRKRKAKNIK